MSDTFPKKFHLNPGKFIMSRKTIDIQPYAVKTELWQNVDYAVMQ